jgi:hypothetical protein
MFMYHSSCTNVRCTVYNDDVRCTYVSRRCSLDTCCVGSCSSRRRQRSSRDNDDNDDNGDDADDDEEEDDDAVDEVEDEEGDANEPLLPPCLIVAPPVPCTTLNLQRLP